MDTNATATTPAAQSKGKLIGAWIAQIVAAGILAMAGVNKFMDPQMLADGLGVGAAVVYLIGVFEIASVALLLIPRLHVYGGILATLVMIGALLSHVTKLGFSGEPGGMWMMALVVLIASVTVIALRRDELPIKRAGDAA